MRPSQSAGPAPTTPASARRARVAAASRRSVNGRAGSVRVRLSRPVTPRSVSGTTDAVSSVGVPGGTSEKSTLPVSSSLTTAESTTRSLAREIASANIRSSSSSTSLRSSSGASPSVTTRTSRWGESSEPRSRRFGHTPSCRPATTTVRNSSPTTPDGVVTSTASSARRGREHVVRHLGVEEFGEEVVDAGIGASLGEALRGGEQRDHAVEVAVRLGRRDSRTECLIAPVGRDAAALPGEPEQLLGCRILGAFPQLRRGSSAIRVGALRERGVDASRAPPASAAPRRAARRSAGRRHPRPPRRAGRAAAGAGRAGRARRTDRAAVRRRSTGVSVDPADPDLDDREQRAGSPSRRAAGRRPR